MTAYGWHDCAEDVRAQVEGVVSLFADVLGSELDGVYLHGSLAMGCFNPARGDIDLLVIGPRHLRPAERTRLAVELLAISNVPAPIELSVLCAGDLRPWRHPAPYELHYSEWWRRQFLNALDDGSHALWSDNVRTDEDLAAHVTIVRERGIAIVGPPPVEAFPAVPVADYVASIRSDVRWAQEGNASPTYAILNTCRTLAYLREGMVLSKQEGAEWALVHLPKHAGAVRRAIELYGGDDRSERYNEGAVAALVAFAAREIEGAAG